MANKVTGPDPLLTLMKSLVGGLPKLPSTLTGVSVEGTTSPAATLGTKLGTYVATFQGAEDADTAKQVADEARDAVQAEAHAFTMATVTALKAALGRTSATLETVGISPDKSEVRNLDLRISREAPGIAAIPAVPASSPIPGKSTRMPRALFVGARPGGPGEGPFHLAVGLAGVRAKVPRLLHRLFVG